MPQIVLRLKIDIYTLLAEWSKFSLTFRLFKAIELTYVQYRKFADLNYARREEEKNICTNILFGEKETSFPIYALSYIKYSHQFARCFVSKIVSKMQK